MQRQRRKFFQKEYNLRICLFQIQNEMRLQKGQNLRLAERKQLPGLRFYNAKSKCEHDGSNNDHARIGNVPSKTARRSRWSLGLQKRSKCRSTDLQTRMCIEKVSRFLSVSKGFMQMELVRRS